MSNQSFLVLIFGASGSGKTTLLRELGALDNKVAIHQKGTDRPPKKYDSDEIICLSSVDGEQYDYVYSQYGYRYGIEKAQIDASLAEGLDHFVICNDIETIKSIKKSYGVTVKTLFLLFSAPRNHIENVQQTRGITDDQIDLRLAKIGVLSELFLDNSELFDGVVLNRLGAPPVDMVRQVGGILDRDYLSRSITPSGWVLDKTVIEDLRQVIEITRANLRDLPADKSAVVQPGYVFILMAMTKSDPLLRDTHAAIKRACSTCELRGERVDDISFTGKITDKVLGSIRCAEFVVADLTHEKPNVYYEVGYAHAYKKPTILVARTSTSIHFDIQGFPIIFYESTIDLEQELVRFFRRYERSE